MKSNKERTANLGAESTTGVGTLVAPVALDSWATRDWSDGVSVDRLTPHDQLWVRTRNSTYEMVVVAPHRGEVLVRGGGFFPLFRPVRVSGASLGGSFLKLHSIHIGFRIELVGGDRVFITSPVQSIAIDRGQDTPPRVM